MANIQDVAQRAGVSVGTVSKYLNNSGYISSERRKAIQRAIEELNYSPCRSARQLRTQRSREIACILPNIEEKIYQGIYISVADHVRSNYQVNLFLTGDSPEEEHRILEACLANGCDGVVICTCDPTARELFEAVLEKIPMVFLMRKPDMPDVNYIGFNHSETIHSLTSALFRCGHNDIALYTNNPDFSCEADCISAFQEAYEFHSQPTDCRHIFSFPYSREAMFRSIMRVLDMPNTPSVFLTTSYASAQAIQEVAHLRNLELGRDLIIIALGEENWYTAMFANKIIATYRDVQKLGAIASETLLDNIASPAIFEKVNLVLQDGFDCSGIPHRIQRMQGKAPAAAIQPHPSKLRVALLKDDYSLNSIKSLVPQFCKNENIDVEIHTLSYSDLFGLAKDLARQHSGDIDIFSIDTVWIPYLTQIGLLDDLTGFLNSTDLRSRISPQILEKISTCNGSLMGIPFLYTLPLLFYRKDLFEDPAIAAEFYRRNKVRLEPPKTWHMYNMIAAFFTRSQNPDSPTQFGTNILGNETHTAFCTELYSRIWSYHGQVIDDNGYVRLYSYENLRAYQSLLETLSYCATDNWIKNTYLGIRQLARGEAAMCTMFSSTASLLLDNAPNPFKGRIGYAPIPGRKPTTAGWNLSRNRYSNSIPETQRFFKWFFSLETASAFTTLGGMPPISDLLEYEPFLRQYPWMETLKREYPTGLHRENSPVPGLPALESLQVESILVSVLNKYNEKSRLSDLIYNAHMELCRYTESMGYPRNIPPRKTL